MNNTKPRHLPIRIPPEMVSRIDRVKPDLVPRETYIREVLLEPALKAEERKAAKR